MKSYIKVWILISIIGFSCGKQLDLLPQEDVDESVVLTSDANVKRALNGAYDGMSSEYLYGGNILLYAELLGSDEELRWAGTYNQPDEIWLKDILPTNSFITNTWLDAYEVINIANNILSAIDIVNEADRDRIKGEALFIRGSLFFELVKLYAKPYSAGNTAVNPGIPLVLLPTRGIDESSFVARSSVEDVYTQAINDLSEAENLLPVSNGIYANKVAAAAQLSRIFLQKSDYVAARDAADRGIGYGGFELASPYAKAFNSGRVLDADAVSTLSEGVFQIAVSAQDGSNSMHLYWSITMYGARAGDVVVQNKHLDLYDPADERLSLFYQGGGNAVGSGPFRSGKWRLQYSNLSIIRLSELFLTRAEANFREGTSVGATPLADINLIRAEHGGLPELSTLTLDDILLERKLELAHEGQAVHDRKRLKLNTDNFAFDADEMVLPVPLREVIANPMLVQNPGYGG